VLDELLVLETRRGAPEAFRQLVLRWTPGLRRHAQQLLRSPEMADDAVQDAWISIARGLRRLEDPGKFPAWAYAITTRRCVDAIRRSARDRRLKTRAARESATAQPGLAGASEAARLDLAAAVARLPLEQRLVVSLHYAEGLPLEDIAAAHGTPVGTLKSRLFLARRALRTSLEGALG
jgi:RNA polymerase sigma-70 factor (ECF subfamily)